MINDEHTVNIRINCGSVSNTKAKLLPWWCLVKFTNIPGIGSLHIFGDSLVIDSSKINIWTLQVIYLQKWCSMINTLLAHFHDYAINHI